MNRELIEDKFSREIGLLSFKILYNKKKDYILENKKLKEQ